MEDASTWKVTLNLTAQSRDAAEDALLDLGAAIVSKPAGANHWRLEAIFSFEPLLASLKQSMSASVNVDEIPWDEALVARVPPRNWIVESQGFRQPVRAGRYYIHEAHSRPPGAPGGICVEVSASLAFGTGQHGSTEGCLRALSDLAKQRQFRNILDVGTGSGILAIAAAKTWRATHIVATDIDPVAIPVAVELAEANGVSGAIEFWAATGFHHQETLLRRPFDLIMANILAEPLIGLAADVRQYIAPQGTVILSGLLDTQAKGVVAAYRAHGLHLKKSVTVGRWVTLVLGPDGRRRL